MLLALQFQMSAFRKHSVYFRSALRFHCIFCYSPFCLAADKSWALFWQNLALRSHLEASPFSTSPLNIRISSSHNTRNDFSVKTGKTEVTFKGLISSPSSLEQGTRFREDPHFFLLEVVCISVCVQTKVLLSLQFLRWSHPLSAFLN